MRALLAAVLLLAAGCGGSDPTSEPERLTAVQVVQALQEGGLVVYVRHGATDQSQVDRDTSDLTDCAGQRNLTEPGREQARTIGRAFRELEIPVGSVLASEYCRTRETAELAFGQAEVEPDLTGFPDEGTPLYEARIRRTRELLAAPPDGGQNIVLVAHTKNLEAAADLQIEEGELAVFEPLGGTSFRYLGRIPAVAWPQLSEELRP